MSVSLDVVTRARVDELADRYGVAAGAIVRECVDAGLRAVTERLRRAARVRELAPADPAIDLRASTASTAGVQDTDDFTDAVMADVRGETGR